MLNIFKTKRKKPEGKKVILKLDGLHCTSCSLNIDGELEDMPGVISANTSYAKSQSQIEFDPQQVNKQKIKQAVEKLGYQVIG